MEHGSLTKASEIHCTSESAASRQINCLENELDISLFSRKKRALTPTNEGQAFYNEARRVLLSLNEIADIARDIREDKNTKLNIVAVPRLMNKVISPALSSFCKENPNVKVNVEIFGVRYLDRWLAGFQYHLGIGSLPLEHHTLETEKFCSVPVMVVLPAEHHLSDREELSIEDLDEEPFVAAFLKQTPVGKNIGAIFQAANRVPNPVIEVATSNHACQIVASGFGYTLADPFVALSLPEGLVKIIPLKTHIEFSFAFCHPIDVPENEYVEVFRKHVINATHSFLENNNFIDRSRIYTA